MQYTYCQTGKVRNRGGTKLSNSSRGAFSVCALQIHMLSLLKTASSGDSKSSVSAFGLSATNSDDYEAKVLRINFTRLLSRCEKLVVDHDRLSDSANRSSFGKVRVGTVCCCCCSRFCVLRCCAVCADTQGTAGSAGTIEKCEQRANAARGAADSDRGRGTAHLSAAIFKQLGCTFDACTCS